MSDIQNLTFRVAGGKSTVVEAIGAATLIKDVKDKVAGELDIPADLMRVIIRGRIAKDTDTLSSLDVANNAIIHVVKLAPKSTTAPVAAPAQTATSGTVGSTPNTGATGMPASFPNMPAGMPNMDEMMRQMGGMGGMGGAGGMPDLAALMNNPAIMQMARDLMSNPGIMQNLMGQMRGGGGGMGGMGGAAQGAGAMPDMATMMNEVQQQMQNPDVMRQVNEMMSSPGNPFANLANNFGGPNTSVSEQTALSAPNSQLNQPLTEETLKEGMAKLREMDFKDEKKNEEALRAAHGVVEEAITFLIDNNIPHN